MKVRVVSDTKASNVTLQGDIDEQVNDGLREISTNAKAAEVNFDCDGVANINSIGIRQWLLFMATFGSQRQLVFRNCPPALIDYATMLPKVFGTTGKVQTLYLGYYCDACNQSTKTLVELAKLKADRAVAQATCAKCSATLATDMDLDAIIDLLKAG